MIIVEATSRIASHILVLAQIAWLSIKLPIAQRRFEEQLRRHLAARRLFFEQKERNEARFVAREERVAKEQTDFEAHTEAREAEFARRMNALAAREARLARDQLKTGGLINDRI
jgi:hypothetical protein